MAHTKNEQKSLFELHQIIVQMHVNDYEATLTLLSSLEKLFNGYSSSVVWV